MTTSGARYFGGPIRGVSSGFTSSLDSSGIVLAKPKSQSLAVSYPRVINTFLALTSLCTWPAACSLTSARATSLSTRTTSTLFTTLRERSEWAMYSITMYSLPSSSYPPNTVTMFGWGKRLR